MGVLTNKGPEKVGLSASVASHPVCHVGKLCQMGQLGHLPCSPGLSLECAWSCPDASAPSSEAVFTQLIIHTQEGSQSLSPAFVWVEETESRILSLVLCLLTRMGLRGFAVNESNLEDSEGKRHCDKLIAARVTCKLPFLPKLPTADVDNLNNGDGGLLSRDRKMGVPSPPSPLLSRRPSVSHQL